MVNILFSFQMYRVCLFLSLVLAVSATPDRANYGNYDAPVPSNNINQGSNQDEVPAPKEAGNARWDSDEGTGKTGIILGDDVGSALDFMMSL